MPPSARTSLVLSTLLFLVACGGGRDAGAGSGSQAATGAAGNAGATGGLGATSGAAGIANSSGTCVAPDDGARRGYSAPGGLTWIPDCQNVLAREYWRVYAASDHDAAILPRPDGDPGLSVACEDTQHALHEVVLRYQLCHSALGADDLALVNHMEVADALSVAHFLDAALVFRSSGTNVIPFAIPSDVLDACALHDNPADLAALCTQEKAVVESGDDIAWSFTAEGAAELAPRLNELYGIQ